MATKRRAIPTTVTTGKLILPRYKANPIPTAIIIIKNPVVATEALVAKACAVKIAKTATTNTRVSQANNRNQVRACLPTYCPIISPTDFPLCRAEVSKPK